MGTAKNDPDDDTDDPFDDDEWRPTARIDMTDVRRRIEALDASEAKTYPMRRVPKVSKELEAQLDAALADTQDEEELPTVMLDDANEPAPPPVDLEAAIIKAKQVTADKRAAASSPNAVDDASQEEILTRPDRPAPRIPMKRALPGMGAAQVPEARERTDSFEEGIPTLLRNVGAPQDSKRPHGIERRRIIPARGAPADVASDPTLDDDEFPVIAAPLESPAPLRPFPTPNPGMASDDELDQLLTDMDVARRRRNLVGPLLLFLVLAAATAIAVMVFS